MSDIYVNGQKITILNIDEKRLYIINRHGSQY